MDLNFVIQFPQLQARHTRYRDVRREVVGINCRTD
jgi:hypothetical protein